MKQHEANTLLYSIGNEHVLVEEIHNLSVNYRKNLITVAHDGQLPNYVREDIIARATAGGAKVDFVECPAFVKGDRVRVVKKVKSNKVIWSDAEKGESGFVDEVNIYSVSVNLNGDSTRWNMDVTEIQHCDEVEPGRQGITWDIDFDALTGKAASNNQNMRKWLEDIFGAEKVIDKGHGWHEVNQDLVRCTLTRPEIKEIKKIIGTQDFTESVRELVAKQAAERARRLDEAIRTSPKPPTGETPIVIDNAGPWVIDDYLKTPFRNLRKWAAQCGLKFLVREMTDWMIELDYCDGSPDWIPTHEDAEAQLQEIVESTFPTDVSNPDTTQVPILGIMIDDKFYGVRKYFWDIVKARHLGAFACWGCGVNHHGHGQDSHFVIPNFMDETSYMWYG